MESHETVLKVEVVDVVEVSPVALGQAHDAAGLHLSEVWLCGSCSPAPSMNLKVHFSGSAHESAMEACVEHQGENLCQSGKVCYPKVASFVMSPAL